MGVERRLSKEEKDQIVKSFMKRYGDDPNINLVCMRYNMWDGDFIEVKVKDIWGAGHFPEIFNGHNVFVEEAPPVRTPLPQD